MPAEKKQRFKQFQTPEKKNVLLIKAIDEPRGSQHVELNGKETHLEFSFSRKLSCGLGSMKNS